MLCMKCGGLLRGKQSKYCSSKCKNIVGVTTWRKKLKKKSLEYKGSKCSICGYSRCVAALVFHHTDENKEFGISSKGLCKSWEKVKRELDKCILVCANCHAEIHWRVV